MIGCKTSAPVVQVPVQTTERIVERLVPVATPPDSAWLKALFECNTENEVVLKELSEEKSRLIQSQWQWQQQLGQLKYNLNTKPEIVYLPARDSIIIREVPYEVEVPVRVNELTGWQWAQVYAGRVLLTMLLLFGAYQVLKWKSII